MPSRYFALIYADTAGAALHFQFSHTRSVTLKFAADSRGQINGGQLSGYSDNYILRDLFLHVILYIL